MDPKRHARHERRRVDRIARRGDEPDSRPAPPPRRRGSRTHDRRLRGATRDTRCARIGAGIGATGGARVASLAPGDKPFVQSPSGARFADLREGTGATPQPGQTVVVEWVGYTSGYQAKKIESTRETDAPYAFKLGAGEAIPAFEEAVSQMRVGGIRRIEIPGELEEKLAYSRDPSQRYAVGPVPQTLGGRRALDFVLDNRTLKDFNRTLLFDIRLSAIRK